nr:MAG TPA: hypothetical protein [Caudoviricetes sp.]
MSCKILDARGGVMKYKLIMEFETENPYKEWDVSPYTNEALAIALINALGIKAKETLVKSLILRRVE